MKYKIENIVTETPETITLPLRKLRHNQRLIVFENVPARKVNQRRKELGFLIQQSKATAARNKKFTVSTLANSKGYFNLGVDCLKKRS